MGNLNTSNSAGYAEVSTNYFNPSFNLRSNLNELVFYNTSGGYSYITYEHKTDKWGAPVLRDPGDSRDGNEILFSAGIYLDKSGFNDAFKITGLSNIIKNNDWDANRYAQGYDLRIYAYGGSDETYDYEINGTRYKARDQFSQTSYTNAGFQMVDNNDEDELYIGNYILITDLSGDLEVKLAGRSRINGIQISLYGNGNSHFNY